jgi:DNA polymerase
MGNRLYIDFETQAAVDISCGQWNYSCHSNTSALCVGLSVNGEPPVVYDLTDGFVPPEWKAAVYGHWEIHAWNAAFEWSIIHNTLKHWPEPMPEMFRDVQFTSLCCGLPAKLGDCAMALRLPVEKDAAGAALINYFCKPVASGDRKGSLRDKSEDPERWAKLLSYCKQDVATMVAIANALPEPSEDEQAFWLATWEMNRRGVRVDRELVLALQGLVDRTKHSIFQNMECLKPEDLTNHRKVLGYVQDQGVAIQSVAKAVVRETLAMDIPQSARSALEARQAVGKTSLYKLDAMLDQSDENGVVRFLTRPHGTATGRDTSMGVQLQNLPRGEKMSAEKMIAAVLAGNDADFTALAAVKGKADPLGGVVTCLRGCFTAAPGTVFHQCDWSAVEPRIGAWLVDDRAMMEAFSHIDDHGGVDIYQIEAARFYKCEPEAVKGDMRQFGKVYVLQNQYESGEASIQRSAKTMFGLELTLDKARECKLHWRKHHPKWVGMWHDLQNGALSAIANVKKVFRVGRCAWCYDGQHLRLRLPSGRVVWFPWALVEEKETPWGELRPSLTYEYIHSVTKQWTRGPTHAGALFNVVVQGTGADLLRHACRLLHVRGIPVVLRVHDELVCEMPEADETAFARFKEAMLTTPAWAEGLRLNGAGWTGPRYKKD